HRPQTEHDGDERQQGPGTVRGASNQRGATHRRFVYHDSSRDRCVECRRRASPDGRFSNPTSTNALTNRTDQALASKLCCDVSGGFHLPSHALGGSPLICSISTAPTPRASTCPRTTSARRSNAASL